MINVSSLAKRQLAIGEYIDCKNRMHKVIHSVLEDETLQRGGNSDKVTEDLFKIFATHKDSFCNIHS